MTADKPDDTRTHETDFAALWSSDGVTRSLSATGASLPADLPFLFSTGQQFGPYQIVRPLGKGGMGQVYEAEEIDSGRRVAVKLLSRGLGDGEERERFLREGQLAAALSHPNCVYVFGTSEVQGFPIITMELAPAGTLKDLVDPAAPMSVATAVDAILQVVAGLEAAAAIGILHRDVKPSNCFVDRDGRVMVGDFGLSISTSGGAAAAGRVVLGTPGFASPEQLRGEALDVRSDIYSVGATLFYLLTGKTPFDGPDLQTMMTRVASEAAPVITAARPDVPGRLGSIVARCLATRPADRYATYAALAAALEPFRTVATVPARLGRRFLAGFIDSYAASIPLMPVNIVLGERLLTAERQGDVILLLLPSMVVSLLYYTLLEGRFGCAAGKAALNLRVVDDSGHTIGFKRALLRTLAFIVPTQLAIQSVSYAVLRTTGNAASADPSMAPIAGLVVILMSFVCVAALFLPARRRNGYAAVHDRLSRTRVIVRPRAIQAREQSRARAADSNAAALGTSRIGPYLVAGAVTAVERGSSGSTVVNGYDDRLRRAVWIELLPAGTPAVPAWRRDLNRPGRVRWISGRRAGADCWDAYEQVEGEAFASAIASPQPWSRVRHWIADTARELASAARDPSPPALRHDRVWIAGDERARLLDWTPPSAPDGATAEPDPQRFLYGLAAGALTGGPPDLAATRPPDIPLPGGARALLLALRDGTAGSPDAVADRSVGLLREIAVWPRSRRLLQLAVCAILPVTMAVAVFAVFKTQIRARTADPAKYVFRACIGQLSAFEKKGEAALTNQEREQRELIEIYIAEHLRESAEEMSSYAKAFPTVAKLRTDYKLAERALKNHPQRSPEQLKRAEAVVAPILARMSASLDTINRPLILFTFVAFVFGGALVFVAVLGLLSAVIFRGGLTFRGLGAMLVTADGAPAGRLRALGRALVAWSPLIPWTITATMTPEVQRTTAFVVFLQAGFLSVLVAGAVWAWRHPSRGLQDMIAGTWIVPREQKTAS